MFVIVIGGMAQGKLSYVLESSEYSMEDVNDGKELEFDNILSKPVLNHFHLLVRRALEQHYDCNKLVENILSSTSLTYLLCDEVGSGIVPMDCFERNYREQVGRILCKLVKNADRVIRMQCGIPTVIKG